MDREIRRPGELRMGGHNLQDAERETEMKAENCPFDKVTGTLVKAT